MIISFYSNFLTHGSISETNMYNGFQNCRARSKRKQQIVAESEVETQVESPKDKKTKPQDFQFQQNSDIWPEDML